VFLRRGGPATATAEAAAALAGTAVAVITVRVGDWGLLPGVATAARFRFTWSHTRGGLNLTGGDPGPRLIRPTPSPGSSTTTA
jgi:hypothetical protein